MKLKRHSDFKISDIILENKEVDNKISFFIQNYPGSEIPSDDKLLSDYRDQDIERYLNKEEGTVKKVQSFLWFYINRLDHNKKINFTPDIITKNIKTLNKFGIKDFPKLSRGALSAAEFPNFVLYKHSGWSNGGGSWVSYYIEGDVQKLVKYIKSTGIIESIKNEYVKKYDDVAKMVKDESYYISMKGYRDLLGDDNDEDLGKLWRVEELASEKGYRNIDFVKPGTDLHKYLGKKFVKSGYIVTTPEIENVKFMVASGWDYIIARL
jgi:hypothetical protein